jgi:hypothetical protein
MTIERPMFPPRADSVDSFSLQPAIGQGDRERRFSESGKPSDGLCRRSVLAGLVVLPVALPAAAAAAADPAFALIAAHRAAEVAHGEVIDAQDEAEAKYGIRSDEAREAADRCGATCDEINAIAWKLATTPPTTLAGVAAVLRFANEVEDAGGDWPNTDAIGPDGWHYQLRATMAAAVEALIKIQTGKAVQS